jgi:hypothetical protein
MPLVTVAPPERVPVFGEFDYVTVDSGIGVRTRRILSANACIPSNRSRYRH